MLNNRSKFVYWAPRVLSILFLCFLAMFSLDEIVPGRGLGEILIGLLMHNLPVIILAGLLVVAWKKEAVGTAAFTAAGCLYFVFVLTKALKTGLHWYYLAWLATIAGPAFLVAWLFRLSRRNRGKQ